MYAEIENWIVSGFYMTLLIVSSLAQKELLRKEVLSKLLNSSTYDANIVPDFDQDVPTNVTIQLMIQDMHSFSETAMEYSIDVFLRMNWRDERLDYTNLSSKPKLELDVKNIGNVWQPAVYFPNEKRASVHSVTTPNELMHIHRNGTVVYSIRLAMTLGCTMTLQYYPFDNQRCPLLIQSFCYTRENIDLQWNSVQPVILAPELEIPQFEVESDWMTSDFNVDVSSSTLAFHCYHLQPDRLLEVPPYSSSQENSTLGTFSTIKVEMDLSRNVGFYFLQVFIPSVLLVCLSWVSFWVDPNAVPARVSLGVTCVLTMTTQSSGIRQSLPPVSYVKAIDVWMCVCLMFVFAALIEFAYVNVLMRPSRPSENDPKTDTSDDDVNATGGEESNDVHSEEKAQPERVNKTRFECLKGSLCPAVHDSPSRAYRVDRISRFAFPGTFVLFLCLFFGVSYGARSFARKRISSCGDFVDVPHQ